MGGRLTNWAGNVTFGARRVHRPSTVAELQEIVARADRVRPLGTGHSFNRLADTDADLVSVADLPPAVEIDSVRRAVTVAGGVRYGELATRLHDAGLAVHNMASLPHISVAGACATGTHGSGERLGNLATAARAVELVTADGEQVRMDRHTDEAFPGAVVSLGALGVVTALTLDVQSAYEVRQYVYEDLPLTALLEHTDEILGAAYSVSVFTGWAGPRLDQVWLKLRADDATPPQPRWLGATLAAQPRHPVPGMSAEHCTSQLGAPGPWHARLPHFRLGFTPSSGEELQSEYVLPRRLAVEAITAIDAMRDRIAPVLQISEIRTVAADELWLSPNYRRDSVAIHFTWIKDAEAVAPVMAEVERRLAPLGARPHWGKLFGIEPERLRGEYERWTDFAALMDRYDPDGKFRNEFLDSYFRRAP